MSRVREHSRDILDSASGFLTAVLAVLLVFTFLVNGVRVDGVSMEDTLYDRDRLLSVGLFYHPKEGDIVICDSTALDKLIVKRVIAVEGQIVTINYNTHTVAVDGKVIKEDYIKYHALNNMCRYDMDYYDDNRKLFEYIVPENCVFLMGDNRDHSQDSRAFGMVKEDEIIGKVIWRFHSQRAKIGKVK